MPINLACPTSEFLSRLSVLQKGRGKNPYKTASVLLTKVNCTYKKRIFSFVVFFSTLISFFPFLSNGHTAKRFRESMSCMQRQKEKKSVQLVRDSV